MQALPRQQPSLWRGCDVSSWLSYNSQELQNECRHSSSPRQGGAQKGREGRRLLGDGSASGLLWASPRGREDISCYSCPATGHMPPERTAKGEHRAWEPQACFLSLDLLHLQPVSQGTPDPHSTHGSKVRGAGDAVPRLWPLQLPEESLSPAGFHLRSATKFRQPPHQRTAE